MRRAAVVASMASALALSACGVQVQDQTQGKFTANPNLGMYPIRAKVTRGAMVSPKMFLFAVGNDQKIRLTPNADGTEWEAMYPIRCTDTFPLQYLAIWRLQGVTTREQLFPAEPREIELAAPPPGQSTATIDTSGKPTKGHWQGSVPYTFATAPSVQITGATLEPTSQNPADVESAKAISIVSTFPMTATCDQPAPVVLESRARQAHANLVIETSEPGMPQFTTRVEFAPQPGGI
jgi:hypothetical protein